MNSSNLIAGSMAIGNQILKKSQKDKNGIYWNTYGEDCSLMTGNAGIGYFLLRLNDTETAPSILIPGPHRAKPIDTRPVHDNTQDVETMILRKYHHDSLSYINERKVLSTNGVFENADVYPEIFFEATIISHCKNHPELQDILALENTYNRLSAKYLNPHSLHLKSVDDSRACEKFLELDLESMMEAQLVLNEDATIHETQTQDPVLFFPRTERIEKQRLRPLSFMVLSVFREPIKVCTAMSTLLNEIHEPDRAKTNLIFSQIKNTVLAHFLIPVHPPSETIDARCP